MSRNEDYLDDLLNSVSDANRRNNKKNIEDLLQAMSQEPVKPREREQVPPPQRRDFGEKFVREFEQEIALGTADDFLRDFEMELDAEASDSQSDIEVNQKDERQDFIDNVSDIVDGAKRRIESDDYEEEQEASQQGEPMADVFPQEEETARFEAEEGFSSLKMPSAGTSFEEMSSETVFSDAPEADGQLMDESVDLMDMLSGMSEDEELSDIGDMLKADEEGEPIDGAGDALNDDEENMLGFGDEDMDDTEEDADVQDEFDRLGSIEELKAISEKKNKKKKSGFFGKLMAALFGVDEEESAEPVAEEETLGSISDENMEILKELDASAAKSASKDKKKKDKKGKKEKEKKEPKKAKPKKVKPPKEKDNTPPLPKKPVILIFVMAISILVLILLGSSNIQYLQDISNAKDYYSKGDYIEAYNALSGTKIKEKDESLYQKVMIMANLQQEYDSYETMMSLKEYELALDALVRGIGRYDNFVDEAMECDARPELEQLKSTIAQALSEQFGVSEEQAKELCAIHKRKDYTKALQAILSELGLEQETL